MKGRFKPRSAVLAYCCRQTRNRAMELKMIEFVRNSAIVMMGLTVMAAAVFVVMYG